MIANLSFNGLDEYLEELAKMEVDFDAAVSEAMLAGAQEVKTEMQFSAPIYIGPSRPDVIPGNLYDHIKIVGPIVEGPTIYCEIGVIRDTAFTDQTTQDYATVMEYGSSSVQAIPFIRPGIQRARKKWLGAVKAKLKEKTGLDFG
jgi:protein-disulfide isomerase